MTERFIKFQEWPKIHRLYRDVIITEKIDGTNACIAVEPWTSASTFPDGTLIGGRMDANDAPGVLIAGYVVFAQSRKKVIAPGSDNYGFARFVRDNAEEIVEKLGPGRHFGEWYGGGIQRGYGMDKNDKRFALFNAPRWQFEPLPPQVTTVPIIYEGVFADDAVKWALKSISSGSWAKGAKGRAKAEGVVVYFKQANTSFKVLAEDDDVSKFAAEQRAKAEGTTTTYGRVVIGDLI
jgi:hypothetical protein